MKEFRLFLNEKLALQKISTRRVTRSSGPLLDEVLDPYNVEEIRVLENLFDSEHDAAADSISKAESVEDAEKELEGMCTTFHAKTSDSLEKLHKIWDSNISCTDPVQRNEKSRKVAFRDVLTHLFKR